MSHSRTRRLLLGTLLAAIALFSYGQWVLGADALDTDRATVLLMARDFAHGQWSVFFWQQNYMAAFEPLLLTPLALLDVLTPTSASLVALALTTVLAVISLRLASKVGGAVWLTALLWALPPAVVAHHHLALYGARLASTVVAVAAFALALRVRTGRGALLVGFLAGLAYMGDHLMLAWAVGIFFVTARRGMLKAVAWGAAPVLVVDTVASLFAPTVHLSGPNDPVDWLMNPIRLVSTTVPQLFGLLFSRPPTPVFNEVRTVIPPGFAWMILSVPAAAVLVWAATAFFRDSRNVLGRNAGERGILLGGLVLTCATCLGLFFFVGGGGDVWPVRYLVPLWPALTVLLGVAVMRWNPRHRIAAVLLVLPALFTQFADPSWPRAGDAAEARAEAEAVRQAVVEAGVQAVWTDYWDTYRMALLVDEGLPWTTTRMLDRRPDWTDAAMEASPVGYLIRPGDTEVLHLIESQPSGAPTGVVATRNVAGFRFFVTRGSIPAALGGQEGPSVTRFTAASVSPLLLFLIALGSVALGTRFFFRDPHQRTTHHPEG